MSGKRKAWVSNRNGKPYVEWRTAEGKRKCKRYPTKKLAEAAAAHKSKELEIEGSGQSSECLPVMREFIRSELRNKSKRYREDMARVLFNFVEVTSVVTISDITVDRITAFQRAREENKVSPHTLYDEEAKVHNFLNWCFRTGRILDNPAKRIKRTKRPQLIKEVPEPEECLRLVVATSLYEQLDLDDANGWACLVLLAFTTGQRQGDLLALQWDQFKWTKDVALMKLNISKTGKQTIVGIPPQVAQFMRERMEWLGGHEDVFLWTQWQRKQWDRLRGAAEFPYSFHALRASFGVTSAISSMQAAGAQALDHSSSRVFESHYQKMERLALAAAQAFPVLKYPRIPQPGLTCSGKPGRPPMNIEPPAPSEKKARSGAARSGRKRSKQPRSRGQ